MSLRVSELPVGEMKGIRIENDLCALTVIPESGAKILELSSKKPSARNFLWVNPRITPTKPWFGLSYFLFDCSGWDECFPALESVNGYFIPSPDHGEVWALPWSYGLLEEHDRIVLRCSVCCRLSPLTLDREIVLRDREGGVTIKYTITNLSRQHVRFQWNIHPMLEFGPASRVSIPAEHVLVHLSTQPDIAVGESCQWPMALHELCDQQPAGAFLVYSNPLSEGWWALTDTETGNGIALVFPVQVFRYIWLWVNYGGWNAYRHIAIEAATDPPGKQSSIRPRLELGPNESLSCSVKVLFYSGISRVSSITPEGKVIGA